MLPTTLTSFLVPLLGWFSRYDSTTTTRTGPHHLSAPSASSESNPSLKFELRHVHAVSPEAKVLFRDVPKEELNVWRTNHESEGEQRPASYSVATRPIQRYRAPSFEAYTAARDVLRSRRLLSTTSSISEGEVEVLGWELDDILAPNVEKREVLLLLAKMANDAYVVDDKDPAWYALEKGWNTSYPFGWEPDQDGFRGHVFATEDNSTVVVSLKGTSAGLFGGGGPTVKKDKLNDNLLFSCCCARVDWTWTTVCGCYRGSSKCDENCLEAALIERSLFYPIGTNLYNNLTYMYPDSNIWIIGHSLGGALASLLGVTFGNPVVTFESPGEKLASKRLHLPQPPSLQHITHVFHTADPIAMGTCNGVLSSCALGGYAMETGCHLGRSIIYDTVTHSNWAVDIRTHGIVTIIDKLLAEPWKPALDQGREVPEAKAQDDCLDCYSWEFGDFPPAGKFQTCS